VMGADTYSIERSSVSSSGPWTVIASGINDFQTPYSDPLTHGAWYRVRAFNFSGTPGPYSFVFDAVLPIYMQVSTQCRDNIVTTVSRA
jgi:hypothetical protein